MKINDYIASLLAFSIAVFAYQISCLALFSGFVVAVSEIAIVYQDSKRFLNNPTGTAVFLMLGRMMFIPTIITSSYLGNAMLLYALTTVLLLEIAQLTGFKFTIETAHA